MALKKEIEVLFMQSDAVPKKVKDGFSLSRKCYIAEALFDYMVSIVCSGSFLAKLTKELGVSDSMTAILTSIVSLAGLFQLVSIYISHRPHTKPWVISLSVITNSLFAAVYLIPVLNLRANTSMFFFIIMLIATGLRYMGSPLKVNWFYSLVDDRERGRFNSHICMVSLIGGMLFTYLLGYIFDSCEAAGDMSGAFRIVVMIIFALALLQFACLMLAKEAPKDKIPTYRESPLADIRHTMSNRRYMLFVIFLTLANIVTSLYSPFLATYSISELGFSLTGAAWTAIGVSFVHFIFIWMFGMLSRRVSYIRLFGIGRVIFLVCPLFIFLSFGAFGKPAYILHQIFVAISSSATSVSTTALIFTLVPIEQRTSALSLNTIFSGALGFLATLLITPLFSSLQAEKISLFGFSLYAQQFLAMIAFILHLLLIAVYFIFLERRIKNA